MQIPPEFQKPPTSLGDWVITVLIKRLPFIGFIMLIVWAVDKDTDPNKANWAKAELIVKLIVFILIAIFVSIIGLGFFTGFVDEIDWSQFD